MGSLLGTTALVQLEEVLEVAYWRSADVFISLYLRDVRCTRPGGRFGVGPVVVAQHVMSSPVCWYCEYVVPKSCLPSFLFVLFCTCESGSVCDIKIKIFYLNLFLINILTLIHTIYPPSSPLMPKLTEDGR